MKIDMNRAVEVLNACGYECEEIANIKQQLAEAQAACSMKDELITDACTALAFYGEQPPEDLFLVITIKPGIEALEKWLGEPVAIIGKHGHPKHIIAIPSIEENRLYGPFEPLYAKPKGIS